MTDGYKLIQRITGVRCAKCEDFIWSTHRHDFHCCKCGYTFIDGGGDCLRFGAGNGDEARKQETAEMPAIETYDILVNIKTGERTLFPIDPKDGKGEK